MGMWSQENGKSCDGGTDIARKDVVAPNATASTPRLPCTVHTASVAPLAAVKVHPTQVPADDFASLDAVAWLQQALRHSATEEAAITCNVQFHTYDPHAGVRVYRGQHKSCAARARVE